MQPDIIWNITLVCPWDCEFCCTDATQVTNRHGIITLREHGLLETRTISGSSRPPASAIAVLHDAGIEPTAFDVALADRQTRGLELQYGEKIAVLENLTPRPAKIDFAGGDPLCCYENYLVIQRASALFGREAISVTNTGYGWRRYDLNNLAELIGQFELTFDEPLSTLPMHRPSGYNASNLRIASEFAKRGVRTKAQLPIHRGNQSEDAVVSLYHRAREANIDEILLMRAFPVGRGYTSLKAAAGVDRGRLVEIIGQYRALAVRYGRPAVRLQCALRHLDGPSDRNPCDLLQDSFGINPRGTLLASAWATNGIGDPLDEAFVLGDLSRHSLGSLLETARMRSYRERLDENFGHCKIFAFLGSDTRGVDALFSCSDPLYRE
jgi:pyruvate-formate lyase-activating enzyme